MIDEIDFNFDTEITNVRVAICQLHIEPDQFASPGISLNSDPLNALEARILRTLAEIRQYKPNIVQFPECSIPAPILPHLRRWSSENDAIIIAGTHYEEDGEGFTSKCPVIFPNGGEYITEKITISPLEKRPVPGKKVAPGTVRNMFRNTAVGDFIVLICSDFLDPDTSSSISNLSPDFLFVSAFQNDSRRYHTVAADMCVNNREGIFICYSNCTYRRSADGKSALFGITDQGYLPAFQESGMSDLEPEQKLWEARDHNDFVICDFNIRQKKAIKPRTVLDEPNIHIVATRQNKRNELGIAKDSKYGLVAFDMDGTLLRGIEFSWSKLWEMCGDDGSIWRGHLREYRRGNLSYADWCDLAIRYFRNAKLDKSLIHEVAKESCRLTANFREGMSILREAGFKTAIISGGVDVFLRAILPDYKSYFDQVFLNTLLFDSDDVVSGVVCTPYDYEGKADALRIMCRVYGLDMNETIFVGDRFNDEHAIKACGHSILYSDARDGVQFDVDHKIESDDFMVLVNYILSSSVPQRLIG